ncbi:signal peptidase I [Acidipila rosea]|uniref:Signal peptidase I n=1 Tax=Acidipila rosea TaxID=768535 RepID=A0A4R1L6F6_9BACT|nr:signal peptidase I [Acidipila rosea]TCK73752.1 signal peptidase I [Acidipila rosea]
MISSEDEIQPATEPAPQQDGATRLWVRDLLLSIIASFFIITFLYQPVKVEGTSMQPELRDQDRLFINKFAYHFEKISRGDVVVFFYPRDPRKSYIKRVVGLPGDDLRIDNGHVYVNGARIPEPYVPERYQDTRSMAETVIPPHEYFVMGDHRSISSDSRDFGPVERSLIYGRAALVYWPENSIEVVR